MAENRYVGDYPVIGIRPTIDGRRGYLKVRESLEEQTMNMAKAAAKLFEENLRYSNGAIFVDYCRYYHRACGRDCGMRGQIPQGRCGYYPDRNTLLVLWRGNNGYGSQYDQGRMGL